MLEGQVIAMQRHTAQAKTLPRIFLKVRDTKIIVSGHTGLRAKALGFNGLGLKWNRDRQTWNGPLNLKNLATLDRWPEVELSAEARECMEAFRTAAAAKREIHAAEGEGMNHVIEHLVAAEKEAQGGSSIWLHIIGAMEELYMHGYGGPSGWRGYEVPREWEVKRLDRVGAPRVCYPKY